MKGTSRRILSVLGVTALAFLLVSDLQAAPRLGSAVTIRIKGKADYRSPEGTEALREGMALTQGITITTHGASIVDAVLSLGAIIRVKEDTPLVLKRLEQVSKGLPGSGKGYARHIVLTMSKGTLFVNAGDFCDCLDFHVETPYGEVISDGSRFIVTQAGSSWELVAISGGVKFKTKDDTYNLKKDEMAKIFQDPLTGKIRVDISSAKGYKLAEEFEVFRVSTQALEQNVMCLGEDECVCFDFISSWIGQDLQAPPPPITPVGPPEQTLDVSPSIRR